MELARGNSAKCLYCATNDRPKEANGKGGFLLLLRPLGGGALLGRVAKTTLADSHPASLPPARERVGGPKTLLQNLLGEEVILGVCE